MTSFRPDQIESIAATLTSTSRASIAISRTCVSVRSVATDDACFGQETQIIPVGLIRPRRSRSCPLSSSWLRTNTWTKSRSPDSGLTIRTPSGKGPRILPEGVRIVSPESGDLDFVQVFVRSQDELRGQLRDLRGRIKPTGMIWVSWPKQASSVATDLTETHVREIAIDARLVDVKVAAIDSIWSGLKLVIRVTDRG